MLNTVLVTTLCVSSFSLYANEFREVSWGMSRDQVIEAEKPLERERPAQSSSNKTEDESRLSFNTMLDGHKVNVFYYFEDGKLLNSGYSFSDNTGWGTDAKAKKSTYEKFEKLLTEKYGPPNSKDFDEYRGNTTSNTVWIIGNTKIKHNFSTELKSNLSFHNIWYSNNAKDGLEKKKTLENL